MQFFEKPDKLWPKNFGNFGPMQLSYLVRVFSLTRRRNRWKFIQKWGQLLAEYWWRGLPLILHVLMLNTSFPKLLLCCFKVDWVIPFRLWPQLRPRRGRGDKATDRALLQLTYKVKFPSDHASERARGAPHARFSWPVHPSNSWRRTLSRFGQYKRLVESERGSMAICPK